MGCVSADDIQQAVAQEQQAEQIVEELESIALPTPEERRQLTEARAIERDLERRRMALEALSRDSLVGTGLDIGVKGARGDYFGIVEILGELAGLAGIYFLARKGSAKDTESKLEALVAERNASRRPDVAQAVQDAQASQQASERDMDAALERLLTRRAGGLSGSLVPLDPVLPPTPGVN